VCAGAARRRGMRPHSSGRIPAPGQQRGRRSARDRLRCRL
jgi:hypothetical protein